MSRSQFRASGGCFWDRQPGSPGGDIRVPAETLFKIRLAGPKSHQYASGVCRGGRWHLDRVGHFASANEAVAAARPRAKASNAYLFVELKVGAQWLLAQDLRFNDALVAPRDEVEDTAFAEAKERARRDARVRGVEMTSADIDAEAEHILDTDERIWEYARIFTAAVNEI
jgi:hypothetical protein